MKIYDSYKYNSNEYIKRIKIEHIFARLKSFKRLSMRYDKLFTTFNSFVYFAFSSIACNLLNKL